jgi:hypothetical protein
MANLAGAETPRKRSVMRSKPLASNSSIKPAAVLASGFGSPQKKNLGNKLVRRMKSAKIVLAPLRPRGAETWQIWRNEPKLELVDGNVVSSRAHKGKIYNVEFSVTSIRIAP